MMYLENHRQMKEVMKKNQLASKERLGNQNLGFVCLLVRTWARRVMITTVKKTLNFVQGLLERNWLLPMPTKPNHQAVSKKDICGKLHLRSCI